MSDSTSTITVRAFREEDRPLIKASWLKGLWYGGTWYSDIPKSIFMDNYSPFLDKLLDSPGIDIKVACLADNTDVVVGYSVASNTVLHWIFCKKAWRKIGISKLLVPATLTAVTHLTPLGRQILKNKNSGAIYNPFIL